MIPFTVQLQSGIPVYKQVVYAARKAIVSGQLPPGERFPSVRQLSKFLRINPNTAQKIVTALTDEGLLQVHPGIGTVITHRVPDLRRRRQRLLSQHLEALVVEAKQLSVPLGDVLQALQRQWQRLEAADDSLDAA